MFKVGILSAHTEDSTMEKLEILFIRACKSRNPERRLKSVYKRFYYPKPKQEYIANVLMSICEKYDPVPPTRFVNPSLARVSIETDYWSTVTQVILGHIRFSSVEPWNKNGMIWSVKYKNLASKV